MKHDELGPETVIRVYDPSVGMRGVLVVDSTANGPAGGGTRMVPDLSEEEVADLARAMTYKWAIFGLPTGGSKAGIYGDPSMPPERKREILRAFGRALRPYLSNKDFLLGLGPDMGVEGKEVDEIYEGSGAPNVASGEWAWKIEGDPASYHLTGCGVAAAARSALASLDRPVTGATFAIEGFGQVGVGTARYIARDGGTLAAVTTLCGGIYDPNGLDVARLIDLRQRHGDNCVNEYGSGQRISPDQLFSLPVDVLIPGARPRVISAFNEGSVQAKILCPAGNNSLTDDAEERLHRRGVLCVPDFIVSGGSIIAGWVDILGGTADQALHAVRTLIGDTSASVLAEAKATARPPGITGRTRVRDRIFATRKRVSYEDARAEARRVLAI